MRTFTASIFAAAATSILAGTALARSRAECLSCVQTFGQGCLSGVFADCESCICSRCQAPGLANCCTIHSEFGFVECIEKLELSDLGINPGALSVPGQGGLTTPVLSTPMLSTPVLSTPMFSPTLGSMSSPAVITPAQSTPMFSPSQNTPMQSSPRMSTPPVVTPAAPSSSTTTMTGAAAIATLGSASFGVLAAVVAALAYRL